MYRLCFHLYDEYALLLFFAISISLSLSPFTFSASLSLSLSPSLSLSLSLSLPLSLSLYLCFTSLFLFELNFLRKHFPLNRSPNTSLIFFQGSFGQLYRCVACPRERSHANAHTHPCTRTPTQRYTHTHTLSDLSLPSLSASHVTGACRFPPRCRPRCVCTRGDVCRIHLYFPPSLFPAISFSHHALQH